ncbi:MAG: NAD(P)/FAD-dependent oxidoreductase [Porticoccus sp.]|nr:NAD(P)/FAD-dependent oxidoreductase [Porticoccus sp.]
MNTWDVVVVGAGAAGLMCAITAGKRGRRVLVLDCANKPGKKILMSGGGRCNFTNLYVEPDNFLSDNPHFCKSALSRYTQWDFIELVQKHHIAYHEKTLGQLFCDKSSKDILEMLLNEAEHAGVTLKTHCQIHQVGFDGGYTLDTSQGDIMTSSLVVASGGLSVPTLGGSDFGYRLAQQFGHPLVPLRPALVPFIFTDGFKLLSEKLSGVSVPACITAGKQAFSENILFTHRGLSGPAVLQISSYWREGQSVQVDLLPSMACLDYLTQQKAEQPKALLRTVLSPLLPRKLVLELEELWWPAQAEKPLAELPDLLLADLAGKMHCWELKPSGTEGYRTAEVTIGGVDTGEISSKTMESQRQAGLYFVGEVLDVTGHLGGFNFQWAWASGYAAGQVA